MDTAAPRRVRRNAHAETRTLSGATGETHRRQFLAEIAALSSAVAAAGQPVWVAGRSARWLLNLPEARRPGDVITLTSEVGASHHSAHDGMTISPAAVPPHHRAQVHGIPTLSAPRVGVDALRTEPLAAALMIGDRALRNRSMTRGQLSGVLLDCRGWPGIVAARQRSTLLDSRRETPLESGSVAMFIEWGLPLPEPQFEVWLHGRMVGRADFAWIEHRVLGEADGRTKYVDDLPNAGPPEQRIWAERLRQDDFQEAEWEVVRWTDFERRYRPERVQQRILAAFSRAERLGLTSH